MIIVFPLSPICTVISLFLRSIFSASNSFLGKFFSRVLPVSFYDEKAEYLSLLLINPLSKLETSKKSTSLYKIPEM